MQYEEFDLRIESMGEGQHRGAVVSTPAGEANANLAFTMSDAELRSQLSELETLLDPHREALSKAEEEKIKAFGQQLFAALFNGELRSLYDRSQLIADNQDKGLRLKLRISSPQLATIPWELLHDARFGDFIALSRNTSIVRYVELPRAVEPLAVQPPLHILGMIASPADLLPLDVAQEKARVERATGALRAKGLVDITWLETATWRELMRAMRRGPWHIFHFVGHSGFDEAADEGYISFCEEDGRENRLSAQQLGRLLKDHKSLQLALLNSCQGAKLGQDSFSSTATTLVRQGIPAVIAMQYDISDEAAIEFANTFYELLAENAPVETAIAEARRALSFAVDDPAAWATPVFHTHAPDSVLFATELPSRQTSADLEHPVARIEVGQDAGVDVGGDKVGGDKISVGDIQGENVAVGGNINVTHHHYGGGQVEDSAGSPYLEQLGIAQGVVRQFIMDRFSDGELATLCFDHFPEVNNEFATGMLKSQKVELLVGYCARQGKVKDLLVVLRQARPGPFAAAFPTLV